MKKVMSKVALIAMIVMMVCSCASTNHEVALSQNKAVKGKNNIERPDWVVYDMSNEKMLYASGYGKGHTFETSMQKAKLNADSTLALWVSTSMDVMRERVLEESNLSGVEAYTDEFKSYASQSASSLLTGVTEVDFWEDKEGGVWVLHSLKKENIRTQVQSVVDSICNEANLKPDEATVLTEQFTKALEEILAK